MWAQRWMWIAWPAFLVAAVLEMIVFAFVDPSELHWSGHPLGFSREAVYSGAFFVFWLGTVASSSLTSLLSMSSVDVNRCPLAANERPDNCVKQAEERNQA